jgi:predicted AAA+ superfamily ATPase
MIETLSATAPPGTHWNFYRTAAGAEIDLLLTLPGQRFWAVEIKRSLTPKVEKGFYVACEDLAPQRRIVVYPGSERFPLQHGVEAMPLQDAGQELLAGA